MDLTVRIVVGWLEDAYPQRLAESWDRVGLCVGDPDAEVTGILFAVDPTDAVVAEARDLGAQLIVTHHPLLLRGVHSVAAASAVAMKPAVTSSSKISGSRLARCRDRRCSSVSMAQA